MKNIVLMFFCISIVNLAFAENMLKACGHSDYPPYMWKEKGRTVGAAYELADIIFRELEINVNNRFDGNFKRCLLSLKEGRYDLLLSAYISEDRKKYIEYSENYINEEPSSIFVKRERQFKFESWDDLAGKKMGTILGGSLGTKWDEFSAKNLSIFKVSSRPQLFKMLEYGRFDFAPSPLFSGLIQLKSLGLEHRIVPLKHPLNVKRLHIAISKKSPYLRYLPYINKRLKELYDNGTTQKIIQKHFEYYVTTNMSKK